VFAVDWIEGEGKPYHGIGLSFRLRAVHRVWKLKILKRDENLLGLERVKWQGKEVLSPGKHTMEFDWKPDGPGLGRSSTGTLKVDGKIADNHPMPRSLPVTVAWDEYFNVGVDTGTSVDDQDYKPPFRFTGKIDKLTVKLGARN
jgi:hypothetical protein